MDKLVKQEACQLFLEQEIDNGLEKGKTPYAIGRDLAQWVEKVFKARISPDTIRKKAERQKIRTTVLNESTTENDSGNEENQVGHGGKRDGAGRPPKFIAIPDKSKFRTAYTGENEWYTPLKYVEAAREVMRGIDLDPATSEYAQRRIKAHKYFTLKDDGLSRDWAGNVWLNPPYSKDLISKFIDKAIKELLNIDQLIILTHNSSDTSWFHALINTTFPILCFTRGRIAFESIKGKFASPTQGSTFFYFGDSKERFRKVFSQFGFILSPKRHAY